MKKLIILTVAALLLMAPAVASANLLDPGFEGTGAGPWSYYESESGYIENFDSASAARTGSQGLEISWAGPVSGYSFSRASQDFSVIAGDPWDVSIYAKTVDLHGGGHAYLETTFWSGVVEVGKFQSDFLTGTNNWTLLTNSGAIPAYTDRASYCLMANGGGGGSLHGTVYFDDASPSGDPVIPEPASLLLLGSGLVGLLGFTRKKR